MTRYLTTLLLLVSLPLLAQHTDTDAGSRHQVGYNIGIGLGMDYGGLGLRGTLVPIKQLGLFASAGYNLNGLGMNAGAQWLITKRRHTFLLTGMYGYNTVMSVEGDINDKGTYYGITAGIGYQLRVGSNGNFWNWEVLVPFRNSNFHDDYDDLRAIGARPGTPLPVTIAVGFHINLRKLSK